MLRVVADAEAELELDLDRVRAALAEKLSRGRRDILRAEELALCLLGEAWEEVEPAVAAALESVERYYVGLPERLAEVRAGLDRDGHDSWIAQMLSARVAFDLAYDALGDIGALR